jgi:hypothetical protein
MNAIDRPRRIDVSEWVSLASAGRTKNKATVRRPRKMPTVRNWRFR